MKLLFISIIALLLLSCGATTQFDYDTKADFTSYSSFTYFPTIESGLNALDNKRVTRVLDSLMPYKGLRKADSGQLLVNFYTAEQVTAGNTIGIGVGSGGGNVGVGVSGGIPIGGNKIEQQFTLDFIDAQNDALVWQGVFNGTYPEKATPAQRQAYYVKVIGKILKGYPPKKK
ncbi:MAG: DUF4136 domain-containing protein [Gilvibacter sp.]